MQKSKLKKLSYGIIGASLIIAASVFSGLRKENTETNKFGYKSQGIRVDVEEYRVSNKGTLYPGGLSSCSVICLYDSKNKVGAMIHSPMSWPDNSWTNKINLEKITSEMVENGAQNQNIKSVSLGYGLKNETKYLQDYLKNSKIENIDLRQHDGDISALHFDVEKGIINFYRANSKEKYSFSEK